MPVPPRSENPPAANRPAEFRIPATGFAIDKPPVTPGNTVGSSAHRKLNGAPLQHIPGLGEAMKAASLAQEPKSEGDKTPTPATEAAPFVVFSLTPSETTPPTKINYDKRKQKSNLTDSDLRSQHTNDKESWENKYN
jgi:hypothetical protein